jgi:GT2 family glycosyltransferase
LPRVFLLDCGDDDGNISISNFRVLYCSSYSYHHDSLSKVYVFSTADGGGWHLVRQSTAAFDDDLFHSYMGQVIDRIDRCLYLATRAGRVKVLDNAGRLEFSDVDLPIRVRKSGLHYGYSAFAVVHGASPEPTASPATVSIIHVRGEDLELFRRIPSSGEWVLEHSIPRLSEATHGLQGYPERSRWMAVDVIAGGSRLAVLKVSLSRGYRRS